MFLRIHEVDGTAENIQHATIDMLTPQLAKFVIETLGIFPLETTRSIDTDVPQILCDTFADTRNTFEAS